MRNFLNIKSIIYSIVCLLLLTILPDCTQLLSSLDKRTKPDINTTIQKYEPSVAVRASGCLTCHAEISSNYITDFGYGSPYFFANPAGKNKVGIFNGHIYGDFIAEPGKTSWLTANFQNEIIVPEAPITFNLEEAAGNTLPDKSLYKEALEADSLARYLRALESKKNKPAPVIEKKKVFIGVPDTETLKARFGIKTDDEVNFRYIKKDPNNAPEIQGIELSGNRKYYTNTGEITCDGDLFIRGMVFLDKPVIVTEKGCRIYATDPVFLQGEITYKTINKKTDQSNLQIVSSEAIFLGVGREKCNSTAKTDPMALRLLKTPALPSIFTRATYGSNTTPQKFMQDLYDKTTLLPLEDSSCHDDSIGFSRLLLNAPIIHSRYSGKFKGMVIAEFALFWQGKTNFEFDPVFKEVPVLPMLKDSDYLLIE